MNMKIDKYWLECRIAKDPRLSSRLQDEVDKYDAVEWTGLDAGKIARAAEDGQIWRKIVHFAVYPRNEEDSVT